MYTDARSQRSARLAVAPRSNWRALAAGRTHRRGRACLHRVVAHLPLGTPLRAEIRIPGGVRLPRTIAMSIRVALADDHSMMREGLAALLQRENDIEVLAQARNGMEMLQIARVQRPDVLVLDIAMPILNGVEVIRRLSAESTPCKMLCLSVNDRPADVMAALDAGASGYVLKENSYDELARAIRRVMANQIFLSGELIGTVLHASRQGGTVVEAIRLPQLTARERQVAQMLAEGHSTRTIAQMLFLSDKTVASHRENTYRKLGISTIAELTRYAMREGLST
ncbi:response regulator [Cupriavidus sp. SW-Y-13]|nr:response regulator [Cupriavidus sp. SW-Y-13]